MIYVILGMHKSGTSLVSQILHLSGINMEDDVDETKGYDEGNHFERISAKELNKELLGCGSAHSLNVILRRPIRVTPDHRRKVWAIIQSCNERYRDWGFKDPRTCLTYSVWDQELPPRKIIVVYRKFEEVLQHYTRTKWRKINLLYPRKALRGWMHYNSQIIAHLKKTKYPWIVISYNELMASNEEFKRLSDFVGRSLVDCRDSKDYRSRDKRLPFMARLAMFGLTEELSQIWSELNHLRDSCRP